MNLYQLNQRILGFTEAVIIVMVFVGYILHETITNPTTPLLYVLWGVLIVTVGYVLKQSVERVATFIDDVRHE